MNIYRWIVSSIAAPLVLIFSTDANASCPPILPCKVTAEASTISGSNADQELITFAQNITTTSNEVATALMDMANANAGALNQSAQNIVATNAELSQINLNQELKKAKAMSDREMAFKQHITESAYRATTAVVSPDDTKEEFQLILDTLGENSDMSVPEIIVVLQETMDKDPENGKVLVQLPSSKGICSEEEVNEQGKCSIAKRVFPGKKLQALFKQCSVSKRMLMEKKSQLSTRTASAQLVAKSSSKALERTDSAGAVSVRLERQMALACTPAQFQQNLCGDMSPEEYQEAILVGTIIPNGDVSAANFNSPDANSAQGYITDLPADVQNDIRQQSLDRAELNDSPNQRVVPIQHTYRNANQVKSAMNFIDNLVADDLLPAASPRDRRKVNNAEYQSRYLRRISALNMVRLVMTNSMNQRVGDKMKAMILSGDFDEQDSFDVGVEQFDNKESVLGASTMDILQDRVNQQSANLQSSDQNGSSTNAGNDFVAAPSDTDAMGKINEALVLQNDLLMRQILIIEQTLSIEAISLSQMANSPATIKMMDKLRKGKR